jgi:hypothetical protein
MKSENMTDFHMSLSSDDAFHCKLPEPRSRYLLQLIRIWKTGTTKDAPYKEILVPVSEQVYNDGEQPTTSLRALRLLNYIHQAVQTAVGFQHISLASTSLGKKSFRDHSVRVRLDWVNGYKVCFPFKLAYILGFCDSPEPSDGSSNDMWHPHHPDATGHTGDWRYVCDSPWLPGGTYCARDPIDVSRMDGFQEPKPKPSTSRWLPQS